METDDETPTKTERELKPASPKVLRRQSNLIKRSSTEIDTEESGIWHNLPKEVWKQTAEVNNLQ